MTRFFCCFFAFAAVGALRAGDWSQFRGPTGQGLCEGKGFPLEWSAGKNVVWKAAVPGVGWSSPIVSKGTIYLTYCLENGQSCHLAAYDARFGGRLWDREVCRQQVKRLENRNSPATPTPATDGERVIVAYTDGTIASVRTADGSVEWINREFPYYSQHGLGASPILHRDLAIMAYDGSSEGPDKKVGWQTPWDRAQIVALDKKTGQVKWKASRGLSRIGHATPIIVRHDGRDVLVSPAGDALQGFDASTGKRLWSHFAEGEGLVPSPSACDGVAFATCGFGKPTLRAIKLGSVGDVRGDQLPWTSTKYVSMMPSMLAYDGRLFVITDKGIVAMLNAKSGQPIWEDRLAGSFSSSPILADGHVYVASDSGEVTVLSWKDSFDQVSKNKMGEAIQATPAFADGRIYVRTKSQLWAIGESR